MSARLPDLITRLMTREGITGRSKLAIAAGRGEKMIDRYRLGTTIPSSDVAYKLAVACGCSPKEAERIAAEYASAKARERLPA